VFKYQKNFVKKSKKHPYAGHEIYWDKYLFFIWYENLEGRNHLADVGIDGRIILKQPLRKCGVRMRIGFVWLRIGTGGRLL
jgi:hypothetical protein